MCSGEKGRWCAEVGRALIWGSGVQSCHLSSHWLTVWPGTNPFLSLGSALFICSVMLFGKPGSSLCLWFHPRIPIVDATSSNQAITSMQDHTWMRGIQPLRPYYFSLFRGTNKILPRWQTNTPFPLLLGTQGIENVVYNWLPRAQLGTMTPC